MQTNNGGTLGKNKDKKKETHPDYSGKINVEGKAYYLSAWVKTNKQTGEKFFSLACKPVKAKAEDIDGIPD